MQTLASCFCQECDLAVLPQHVRPQGVNKPVSCAKVMVATGKVVREEEEDPDQEEEEDPDQ